MIDLGRPAVGAQIQEIVNGHLAVLNVVQDAPAHLEADQEVATTIADVRGRVRPEEPARDIRPRRLDTQNAVLSTRTDQVPKTP